MGTRKASPSATTHMVERGKWDRDWGVGKHLVQRCVNYGASVYTHAEVLGGEQGGVAWFFCRMREKLRAEDLWPQFLLGSLGAPLQSDPLQITQKDDSGGVVSSGRQQVGVRVPDAPQTFCEVQT